MVVMARGPFGRDNFWPIGTPQRCSAANAGEPTVECAGAYAGSGIGCSHVADASAPTDQTLTEASP